MFALTCPIGTQPAPICLPLPLPQGPPAPVFCKSPSMTMFANKVLSSQESDGGEKSDGDLVVDVGNEDEPPRPPMAINGDHRDSTGGGGSSGGDRRPPSNLSSSSRSTPSAKNKDGAGEGRDGKPGTPSGSSKPTTPNGHQQANGKPPTPGMPGYPPGFPVRPGGPGAELPLGYPYQNGVPPGLPGAFPPRPPLVSDDMVTDDGVVLRRSYYPTAWSRSPIARSLAT